MNDFPRVVALTRSQYVFSCISAVNLADCGRNRLKVALRDENTRAWHEVENDFLESEYRAVRDRQMKELEMEDDLLNKVPVRWVLTNSAINTTRDANGKLYSSRNLRKKIYKESYEFVKQQRIQCLLQGAWFVNAIPVTASREAIKRPSRPWRFMRLV